MTLFGDPVAHAMYGPKSPKAPAIGKIISSRKEIGTSVEPPYPQNLFYQYSPNVIVM